MIALGYLAVDTEGYGALQLTEQCRPLLRGEQNLQLSVLQKQPESRRQQITSEVEEENQELWQALRACRKQLADENNVPPFVIFHDTTLKEIMIARPQTRQQMLMINGVGDQKLEKYGEPFMAVIREYSFQDLES